MASSTLFPPIIKAVQPIYDITKDTAKVYFSLSSFNSFSDVKQVQVSARYQTSNNNALASRWTNGILLASVSQSSEIEKEKYAPYYITISKNDLIDGFVSGQVLKIQLRNSAVAAPTSYPTADWLSQNKDYFSEWSTVSLFQGTAAPEFLIPALESESTDITFASTEALFLGTYIQGTSSETLRYWRVKLLDENGNLLADSSEQIYDNSNYIKNEDGSVAIECKLPYQMSDETKYILEASIETRNGYIINKEYNFTTLAYSDKQLEAELSVEAEPNEGYFKLSIKSTTGLVAHTGIILRRTDAKSNFTIWEDIAGKTFANDVIDWEFIDFTPQSGTYYQYAIQSIDNYSNRGQLIKTDAVMMEYDDCFLYEKGQQLKLRYDFNISNLDTRVYEQVVDTIGDQYAHILRNGEIYYRTFSCSGLITQLMDLDNHLFIERADVLDNQVARWEAYRDEQRPWHTYDYTAERNFRQYVEKFLYNGEVKLFKSLQEGNILVKLDASSISLTPKQELGRLMYEFTATAYEVAAPNISNYINFELLDNPQTSLTDISFNESKLGRINGYDTTIMGGYNILNLIRDKYNIGVTHNGIKPEDFTLSYLRLEFDSNPYLIDLSGDVPRPLDDVLTDDGVQETPSNNMMLGYAVQIGDTVITIPSPHNIYEMKGDNIEITSNQVIAPLKDATMNIDFIINLQESEDLGQVATSISYYRINGQIWDVFEPNEDLYNRIFTKYFIEKKDYYTNLTAILTVNIEAPIGTEFSVKYSNGESSDFTIGETNELFIDPNDRSVAITSIKFKQKTDAIVNYYIQTVKGVY